MITSSTNKITYKGDGSTKVFPIPFDFIENKDLTVYIVKDGATTQLEKDYYIDTTAKNVNYPGYAPGEEPAETEQPAILAEGEQIVIARSIPLTQERDLGNIWPFDETEKALDKLTMIAQDNQERLNRAVKLPISSAFDGDFMLPDPKAGNCIAWNADGTALESVDLLTPVTEQANAAKTYAEAAMASKEASAKSEAESKKALRSLEDAVKGDKEDILKYSMELMDQNETDLTDYVKKLEDQMDASLSNAQLELTNYVESAKKFAAEAKAIAGFNPTDYYTKTEVDEKIASALQSIEVYDGQSF